MVKCVGFDFSV